MLLLSQCDQDGRDPDADIEKCKCKQGLTASGKLMAIQAKLATSRASETLTSVKATEPSLALSDG
jgi:hypothetical protein